MRRRFGGILGYETFNCLKIKRLHAAENGKPS